MPEIDPTIGESRVLVTYNQDPEHLANIAKIRQLSAELIDFLDAHKNKRTDNGAVVLSWETARVYATAMTEIEGACMWAIKAICK